MQIVILDGYTENPGDLSWDDLRSLGEVTVYDRSAPTEIVRRIWQADIVITNKAVLDRTVLEKCSKLKYIGVLATGYNVVDIKAAKEKGIIVTNIPTYGTAAVGQFAIALLLEICHRIGHHNHEVQKGRWTNNADWCFWDYPLIELAGKTMGIIGFGRIGQTTGKIAAALGMNIIAYDKNQAVRQNSGAEYVDLAELWARSDVICLHCPLFPDTAELINRQSIAAMKDGVIIINNSRGQLICEADLAEALNSGKVLAAGLDVVSTEPIREDNPLLEAKNCFITPHISWAPKASRKRLLDIAVNNLKAFLAGQPVNVVNK